MRCNCVPPGTYGHKNVCPCYASLKTHGDQPNWKFRALMNLSSEIIISRPGPGPRPVTGRLPED
ncbi:Snakin-2 protein [Nymphaea thermarum]|nr:Snakin-2 protein [Nymphaea thermarum]